MECWGLSRLPFFLGILKLAIRRVLYRKPYIFLSRVRRINQNPQAGETYNISYSIPFTTRYNNGISLFRHFYECAFAATLRDYIEPPFCLDGKMIIFGFFPC
jgi:hypothetical protein